MIPTRTIVEIKGEHELEKVATAIRDRFGLETEIDYPQDPYWVIKDIGVWFLDIELPDDHISVQWRPYSGFRLVCPGDYHGEVQEEDWIRYETHQEVIDHLVVYLTEE